MESVATTKNYLSIWKKDLFKGKVCFITGGSGTICSKQAEALVILGCSVSIIGRKQSKVDETIKQLSSIRNDVKVVGFGNIDVRLIDNLVYAVDETVKQLGKIDFVIAGAAGNFIADFNHLSSNAFKTVIDIDTLGSFNTVKACYEQLRLNKGSVLFISATFHYYGVPFQSHVGAAKAAIDALSNALAVELGVVGIRVNALAPGAIAETEGFERLVINRDQFEKKIPLQRVGKFEDIANATIFLFSDAASYITGTVQIVDGGFWHMGNFNTYNLYPETLKEKLLDKPKL